jgi:hypothetical protein
MQEKLARAIYKEMNSKSRAIKELAIFEVEGKRGLIIGLLINHLLTYMALQPRFVQGLSEKIPPLYSMSSEVRPVTGPKSPAIAFHAIRPPEFRSSLVYYAFRHGRIQGSLW